MKWSKLEEWRSLIAEEFVEERGSHRSNDVEPCLQA